MAHLLLLQLSMRMYVLGLVAALATVPASAGNGDREITIAGRSLSCGSARIYEDNSLPNLGMAIPQQRVIVINPRFQKNMPAELKWFIFYHECGHINGHMDEKRADAFAIARATEEGWLTAEALNHICHSWGPMDAGPTATHPAPQDRCNAVLRVASAYGVNLGEPAVGTMITGGPRPPANRTPAAAPAPAKVEPSDPLSSELMMVIR